MPAWAARGVAVGLSIAILIVGIGAFRTLPVAFYAGRDFTLYRDATAHWLATGSFYPAVQLTGPYWIVDGAILYPPVALWLFVPFTVLPAVLWWAIPLAAIAWAIWRLRPRPWAWPLMAICLAMPVTQITVLTGNPALWAIAGFALGCVYAGPAVLVLLKPSLFPFALMGANRRRWWLALALFAALSLPFGAMWLDWAQVLQNSRNSAGLAYSWGNLAQLAFVGLAWLGRQRAAASVEKPNSGM